MKRKIPVILCVDTGIDDASAIFFALGCKNLDIKLFVCGYGNTSLENCARNTLNILDFANAPLIPVVMGNMPNEKRSKIIYRAHGENGLGGYILPESNRQVVDKKPEDAIYEVVCKNQNIHIITLGPLTTIASTFKKYPDIQQKIEKLIAMGGSIKEKLDTEKPYTEFNIASDPESAEIVINSGVKILMVPTEMGRIAYLDYQDIYKIKNLNYIGDLIEKLYRNYKPRGLKNCVGSFDSTTICALSNPEIMQYKPALGFVKYFDNVDTGVCLFDFNKQPNMEVAINIDPIKFKKVYFKALKKSHKK